MTEKWVPDCHDSGCRYAKTRGGMRTQGGKCRCMERALEIIEAADALVEAYEQWSHEPSCLTSKHDAGDCTCLVVKRLDALAAYRKVRR